MKIYSFVLLLLALLVISGCDRTTQEKIDPAILEQIALLPQDVNVLGYAHFEKIHESPFFTSMTDTSLDELFLDDEYAKFYQQTQLDLQKDIHKIFVAGKVIPNSHKMNGLFVAQGKYDSNKIIDYIESHKKQDEFTQEEYSGITLYRPESKHESNQMLFGFVNDQIFIAGRDSLVKSWIDRKQDKNSHKVENWLVERINRLKYKNCAWFTMDTESVLKNAHLDQFGPEHAIKKIKYLDFSFDLTEIAKFHGELNCDDSESTELFKDTIKGAISSMKLSVSDDREAVDIINKIKVKSSKRSIQIDFKMTQQDIETLKAKGKSFHLPTV